MIAEVKAGPFFKKLDYSKVPISETGSALKSYLDADLPKIKADTDAVQFYLMNHIFQVICDDGEEGLTPARELFLEDYIKVSTTIAKRAFYYLLIVCTREARHIGNFSSSCNLYENLKTTYGEDVATLMTYIDDSGSSGAVNILKNYTGTGSIGNYTAALVDMFYKGSFSGGYGGPAWGRVTDCLRDYTHGKITLEMMLDTVWTLAHNNGPIFNKPYIYEGYTHDLKTLLDIQRSGQIPQLLDDYSKGIIYVSSTYVKILVEEYKVLLAAMGGDSRLRGHLDWYKVEALGAVGKYSGFKNQQDNKEIPSAYKDQASKVKMVALKKKEQKSKLDDLAYAEELKTMFVVDATIKLKKLKREEL